MSDDNQPGVMQNVNREFERRGASLWRELTNGGVTIPYLGDRVLYVSHVGDGVKSPADVLRTVATTHEDIMQGWIDSGVAAEGLDVKLPGIFVVDLLVHGLAKDYRVYGVPFSEHEHARTWHWPESK